MATLTSHAHHHRINLPPTANMSKQLRCCNRCIVSSFKFLVVAIAFINSWSPYSFSVQAAFTPSFAEPVPNVTVVAGKDAVLPCIVDNLEHFKVAWVQVEKQTILTIHTKVISRNQRVSLAQSSKRHWYLRLKNVAPEDRGFYMCQINTDPMEYSKGYLEVLVPPQIVDSGTTDAIIAREGANVSLSCQGTGHPEPNITWKREDGREFSPEPNQKVTIVESPVLQLAKASRLHMGTYLCIASNGVPPSVSQRIHLQVQFPPMLWIQNQQELAYSGQDVVLGCHIEAHPKSMNYWTTAKGDLINSGDKYEVYTDENSYKVNMELRIRSVSREDYGGYLCVAKNSLGETTGTIKLYEKADPRSTTGLAIAGSSSSGSARPSSGFTDEPGVIRHSKKNKGDKKRTKTHKDHHNSHHNGHHNTEDNGVGDVAEDEAASNSVVTSIPSVFDNVHSSGETYSSSSGASKQQLLYTCHLLLLLLLLLL